MISSATMKNPYKRAVANCDVMNAFIIATNFFESIKGDILGCACSVWLALLNSC